MLMKLLCRLSFVIVLLVSAINGLSAQCQTWYTSPRKSEAEEAYRIYRPLINGKRAVDLEKMAQSDFNIAFDNWTKAYEIAPAADGQRASLFSDGRLFHKALMVRKKEDEAFKKDAIATVMRLYDEEIKCYGKEAVVLGRKGYDMFYYLGYGYADTTFQVLKLAFEKGGQASESLVLTPLAEMAVHTYQSQHLSLEALRAMYDKITACAKHNIQTNAKLVQEYKDALARVEKVFGRVEGFKNG